MPETHDRLLDAAGPAASWQAHKTLYVVVFVAAGLLVYQWGRQRAYRTGSAQDYSATAAVRQQVVPSAVGGPGGESAVPEQVRPDSQGIRQQIASEANVDRAVRQSGISVKPLPDEDQEAAARRTVAEVQRSLRVDVGSSSRPDEIQVSVTCTRRCPQYAAQLANWLAERYAADCRAEWKAASAGAYTGAREAAERSEADCRDAKARLDAFVEKSMSGQPRRQPRPAPPRLAVLSPPGPAEPVLIDSPQWRAVYKRLQDLQRQRDDLLVERTPQHPAVHEMDLRIRDLKRELATKVRWIPGPQPETAVTPPARVETPEASQSVSTDAAEQQAETLQTFRHLKEAVQQAGRVRDAAVVAERQTWQTCLQEPRVEVDLAQTPDAPPPSGPGAGLLLTAVMAGLSAAIGAGMISAGVTMDTTLMSVAELEAILPVPVISVVPTDDSEPDAASHRRHKLLRPLLIVGGLLLLAVCAGVLWMVG